METKRLLAVDGVEYQIKQRKEADQYFLNNANSATRDHIVDIYEKAVWCDANLNGSVVIDPYFNIHFYEEEDKMAFKLRWTEADS